MVIWFSGSEVSWLGGMRLRLRCECKSSVVFRLQQVAGLQAAVADLEATVQLCEVALRSTCSKCMQSAVVYPGPVADLVK